MKIGSLLTAGLMTFAGKIIAALGIGFVSYKGIDLLQGQFARYLQAQLGHIPADALQIFYMAGGEVFLNWIFGALAFIAGIKATSKLTAVMKAH